MPTQCESESEVEQDILTDATDDEYIPKSNFNQLRGIMRHRAVVTARKHKMPKRGWEIDAYYIQIEKSDKKIIKALKIESEHLPNIDVRPRSRAKYSLNTPADRINKFLNAHVYKDTPATRKALKTFIVLPNGNLVQYTGSSSRTPPILNDVC